MLEELCVAASSPGQIFSFLEEIRAKLLLESMGWGEVSKKRREEEAGAARRREQSEPSRDQNGVDR